MLAVLTLTAPIFIHIALGFTISRWLRKEGFSASALRAMGMAVSNSGFIGYPILGQRFGLEERRDNPPALCRAAEPRCTAYGEWHPVDRQLR